MTGGGVVLLAREGVGRTCAGRQLLLGDGMGGEGVGMCAGMCCWFGGMHVGMRCWFGRQGCIARLGVCYRWYRRRCAAADVSLCRVSDAPVFLVVPGCSSISVVSPCFIHHYGTAFHFHWYVAAALPPRITPNLAVAMLSLLRHGPNFVSHIASTWLSNPSHTHPLVYPPPPRLFFWPATLLSLVCMYIVRCLCHLCSISRWLKTRQVCPLDNSDWEFQKYGR